VARAEAVERVLVRAPTLVVWPTARALHCAADAIRPGDRVLLVDDLVATGGTAAAAVALIERAGGIVVGAGVIIDHPVLGGARKLRAQGLDVHALVQFEGD
jgi:adenine phosphoribosyltransferase